MPYLYTFCNFISNQYPDFMYSVRNFKVIHFFLAIFFLSPVHFVSAQSSSALRTADSVQIVILGQRLDKLIKEKQYADARVTVDSMMAIARNTGWYKEIGDSYFDYAIIEKSLGNSDGLISNLKTAISYYRRDNAWLSAGKAYAIIGQVYTQRNENKTAIQYYLESLNMRERIGDSLGITNNLLNIGGMYYRMGNYYESSSYFFRTLQMATNIHNDKLRAFALSNMSNVSNKFHNYKQSIDYLNEALTIHQNAGNKAGESGVLMNMGNTYFEQNNFVKAKEYFLKSLEIKTLLKVEDKGLAGIYSNMGVICKQDGDTARARYYYNQSLALARKVGDKEAEANALNNLGAIGMGKNGSQSEKLLLQSLEKAKEIGDYKLIMLNCKNLQEFYSGKGNHEQALKYAALYQALNDSAFKETNASKILELQAKYETAEKEKQLANLTREKLEQQLQLQKANQFRYSLIGLSIFLLVLSALIYSRYLIKKRSQQQLSAINIKLNELNNTKDKIFSIVSHDLKNSVSAFTNITNVMNTNFDAISSQQLRYYVSEMSISANGMKGLFRNLLDWAKSQRNLIAINPVEINIPDLIAENISQVQTQLHRKHIDAIIKIPENLLVVSDFDILTTVLRNLITNAIKYSHEGGKIEIIAFRNENSVKISVTDFGMGMDAKEAEIIMNIGTYVSSKPDAEGEKGAGLGLMLCKELLIKIAGKLHIKSEKGKGSTFTLTIPELGGKDTNQP